MIKLANGAKTLAAYVTIPDHPEQARATGVVLAEWHANAAAGTGEFVTWNVWEGDPRRDIFEAEVGHYFSYRDEMDRGRARQEAEIDYGKRLMHHLTANMDRGIDFSKTGVDLG